MDAADIKRINGLLKPGQIVLFVAAAVAECLWLAWQNHAICSVPGLEREEPQL
jgi:hypothetical protein